MKKKQTRILLSLLLACAMVLVSGCNGPSKTGKSSETTKVTLNEVAHSIFYAPMYVAIEEGCFAEEGIDLTLVTGFGVIILVQNTMLLC